MKICKCPWTCFCKKDRVKNLRELHKSFVEEIQTLVKQGIEKGIFLQGTTFEFEWADIDYYFPVPLYRLKTPCKGAHDGWFGKSFDIDGSGLQEAYEFVLKQMGNKTEKPTQQGLWSAEDEMRDFIVEIGVKNLLPRLGRRKAIYQEI